MNAADQRTHKRRILHLAVRIILLFLIAYGIGVLAGRLHTLARKQPPETETPGIPTDVQTADSTSSEKNPESDQKKDTQIQNQPSGQKKDTQIQNQPSGQEKDTQIQNQPSGRAQAGQTEDTLSGRKNTVQEPKQIAITFDDGPNPYYTEDLLKGLKERGVKATFFVLGAEVEKFPEILEHIHEDGHLIGVHSYEHVNFGQIGDEAAKKQIDRTRESIYAVTGEYTGFIRPPYGCWKDSLDEKVDMIEVLWDVDPLDWATADADTVTQRILKDTEEGSIILLHDASQSSVQAALTVIDALTEQGYEFVTVDELLLE